MSLGTGKEMKVGRLRLLLGSVQIEDKLVVRENCLDYIGG